MRQNCSLPAVTLRLQLFRRLPACILEVTYLSRSPARIQVRCSRNTLIPHLFLSVHVTSECEIFYTINGPTVSLNSTRYSLSIALPVGRHSVRPFWPHRRRFFFLFLYPFAHSIRFQRSPLRHPLTAPRVFQRQPHVHYFIPYLCLNNCCHVLTVHRRHLRGVSIHASFRTSFWYILYGSHLCPGKLFLFGAHYFIFPRPT